VCTRTVGVHRMSRHDFGVSTASQCWGHIRKPCLGDMSTTKALAPPTILQALPLLSCCHTSDNKMYLRANTQDTLQEQDQPHLSGWMACTG
jgi:hypothetical protein